MIIRSTYNCEARVLGFPYNYKDVSDHHVKDIKNNNIDIDIGRRRIGSEKLLRKIGFSASLVDYYKRRALDCACDRVAPSGPDPHHH